MAADQVNLIPMFGPEVKFICRLLRLVPMKVIDFTEEELTRKYLKGGSMYELFQMPHYKL